MTTKKRTAKRSTKAAGDEDGNHDGDVATVATELAPAGLLEVPGNLVSALRATDLENALVDEINDATDMLTEALHNRNALDARISELQLAIRDRRLKIRVLKSIS